MANLIYATTNLIEAGSLAATPALETNLPVANLLDDRRSHPARTTSTASQTVKGNFSANTTLDFMLMWAYNLTDAATRRLRIYDAIDQGGSLLLDVAAAAPHSAGLFDNWPAGRAFGVAYFTQQTTARSWQLDITDAANPDGYMQVGQLLLGQYSELEFNFEWGAPAVWLDGSQPRRSGGGGFYRSGAATQPWRELSWQMSDLSAAERAAWMSFSLLSDQLWVDQYPEDADAELSRDHSMLGYSLKPIKAPRLATLKHRASISIGEA